LQLGTIDFQIHREKVMRRPFILKIVAALAGLLILAGAGGYFWLQQRFAALPNDLQHISGPIVVPFEWVAHKQDGVTLPYAAMLVPVNIGGCKSKFRMQFDLGATSSLLYRKKIDDLGQRCAVPPMIERDGQRYALNMDIGIGEALIYAAEIHQRNTGGTGIDWSQPEKLETVGTLGSDLIDGKWLVLDYPARKIIISDSLPSEYSQPPSWGTFTFENRRVMLAAKVDGRDTRLYFDTGTSAFELLTSAGTWEALAAPNAKPDVLTMNSWGRPLTAYRVKSDKEIEVAGTKLPLGHVTRIEGASVMQNLLGRVINMGGMTGNALFVEKVLGLDVKGGRVGVAGRK
jgi:hypothetical protein